MMNRFRKVASAIGRRCSVGYRLERQIPKGEVERIDMHGRQDLPDLLPLYRAFPELPLVSISSAEMDYIKKM